MRKLLFASVAAVLMTGSFANADNPLIPNDNDHMQALNFAIGQAVDRRQGWYGAQITTSTSQGGGVVTGMTAGSSRGFLLHSSENDHKRVENQYAR